MTKSLSRPHIEAQIAKIAASKSLRPRRLDPVEARAWSMALAFYWLMAAVLRHSHRPELMP